VKKKIFIIGSTPFSILNFRIEIIKELIKKKYKIYVFCIDGKQKYIDDIKSYGIIVEVLKFQRDNFSLLNDLKTIFFINKKIKLEKPDLIFSYNIKPNLYCGIIKTFTNYNYKFIPMVTGLGTGFYGKSIKRKIIKFVLKKFIYLSFVKANRIIFQNKDNANYLINNNIIKSNLHTIISGSGVDSKLYPYTKIIKSKPITFLMISRLVNEKGVKEYYLASKEMNKKFNNDIYFILAGSIEKSIDKISNDLFIQIKNDKCIKFIDTSNNLNINQINNLIKSCHVYVLPSYHEGMPRSVLEAMSIGRPIITTNTSGCKETVVNGINGFLTDVGNVSKLTFAMTKCIQNFDNLQKMGDNSFNILMKKFETTNITKQYISLFENELLL
jgi:glycosyltransferase involved in cell wall biosynthesis